MSVNNFNIEKDDYRKQNIFSVTLNEKVLCIRYPYRYKYVEPDWQLRAILGNSNIKDFNKIRDYQKEKEDAERAYEILSIECEKYLG